MNTFQRLAPYIRDFIYRQRWDELRAVQVAACDVIFNSDDNLLLSTGTASGKTEAAFLPVLTKLYEEPSASVGILYISPLKALINDQFYRLDYLLREGDVPVCKWHGDAPRAAKNRLLRHPSGVLQITPESLESLLINKQTDCIGLFRDLRFIIIDEVHYFMMEARGIQLLCQLERIQRLVHIVPRRIGLSATLGDCSIAESWLNSGTGRRCNTPMVQGEKRKMRIAMERFIKKNDGVKGEPDEGERAHFEYVYKNTVGKKSIIFANSRAMVEFTIANLKKIAAEHHTPDVYRVHHGSVSAVIREETEQEMKLSEEPIVTGATVTLELGIDIGTLDGVVQIGAPFSVSGLTQRIGRCGRRGQGAQLLFTFVEEEADHTDFFGGMDWDFLRTIAILQLYLEEKWVEPILPSKVPYALLYHQTMAYLLSNGEVSPAVLAQNVLTLSPFKHISQADYKKLLQHLIAMEQIQKTERGGLIIGKKGEGMVSHYQFYAVFEAPVEYTVKCESETIGTVQQGMPVGNRFALAGRSWECINVSEKSNIIFVKAVKGTTKIGWNGQLSVDIHTNVIQKMKHILCGKEQYAYLSKGCTEKLEEMRHFARESKFTDQLVVPLSQNQFAVLPWVGTKQICALHFALEQKNHGVKPDKSGMGYYLVVESKEGRAVLEQHLREIVCGEIDKYSFILPEKIQIPYKFNYFIPQELLKKQFLEDFMDTEGLKEVDFGCTDSVHPKSL